MRHSILGLVGGKRRRRFLLAVAASVAALGAFMISNAFAVHDLVFQLDGDVDSDTTTTVVGNTQTIDWDQFFNGSGEEISPLPGGFTASSFDRDFATNPNGSFNNGDDSTFTTGSKDTLPITGGWECTGVNNENNKDDIMNAYAASYDPAGGPEVLYFALERNGNNGASNVGFWFLQDENVNCTSPEGATTPFEGDHVDGDLLVVSEFSQGGVVSTINVYRWNGGANGPSTRTPSPAAPTARRRALAMRPARRSTTDRSTPRG